MQRLYNLIPIGILAIGSVAATAQPAQPSTQESPIIVVGKLRPSPDMIVRTVFIGDLDLKSARGKAEMEKRVGAAVDSICAIPTPLPSYGPVMEKPCRDEAWSSAKPQMEAALLKAKGRS